MKTIQLTQNQIAFVDDDDFEFILQAAKSTWKQFAWLNFPGELKI